MFDWLRVWLGFKCRFWRDCPLFRGTADACVYSGGYYYGDDSHPGCFVRMCEGTL